MDTKIENQMEISKGQRISICDGWIVYTRSDGSSSIVSMECARKIEEGIHRYNAFMDINKGGCNDWDSAYTNRGFVKKLDSNDYVYENYYVDRLISISPVRSIQEVLIVPNEVMGIQIRFIADRAFANQTVLRKVILPESVKEIGESAFEGCIHLDEILIPSNQVIIKDHAFRNTLIQNASECPH